MPVADALAMIADRTIVDSKTILTLLWWDMQRRRSA